MAYVTLEDLMGTIEVIVFSKAYEQYHQDLAQDNKVFIKGRVQEVEEDTGKLICESVIPFDATKKELWLQFPDKETYLRQEEEVLEKLAQSPGKDSVAIYCMKEKAVKRLPASRNVDANKIFLGRLSNYLGENNVKVVEKAIENHT